MPAFHRLDPDADARFLESRTSDPLTGVAFRPTNEVVRCATCGTVALRETWEALDGCPNGHDTPAPWTPAAGASASGDGAATRAPRPPAAPPAQERRWLTPLLVAVGVAGCLVLGVFVAGLLTNDDEAPVVTEPVETSDGPSGPEAVAVAAPGLIEGALRQTDFEGEDGRYEDLYTFAADSSGRVLSFRASSEAFYPRLVVETPSGARVVAELVDEDPDTQRTVAVAEELREPGLYRIRLSSRQPAETGDYAIRIGSEVPVRAIEPGATVRGTLGEYSERAEGFFRDRYRFAAADDREYTVTVSAADFAPTVAVEGPGGAVRGETGRAGSTVTFVFTPSQEGPHTVVVSSQAAGARGQYRIELAAEDPVEEPTFRPLPTTGAAVSDTLAAGATQTFGLEGRVGDRLRIEVRADGFAPSLTLVGPDGARQSAAPDGDRARLRDVVLPTAGTYRVIVGASGGGGTFTVTAEQQAAVEAEDIPRLPGQFRP